MTSKDDDPATQQTVSLRTTSLKRWLIYWLRRFRTTRHQATVETLQPHSQRNVDRLLAAKVKHLVAEEEFSVELATQWSQFRTLGNMQFCSWPTPVLRLLSNPTWVLGMALGFIVYWMTVWPTLPRANLRSLQMELLPEPDGPITTTPMRCRNCSYSSRAFFTWTVAQG